MIIQIVGSNNTENTTTIKSILMALNCYDESELLQMQANVIVHMSYCCECVHVFETSTKYSQKDDL